jgi:hypothetical protein
MLATAPERILTRPIRHEFLSTLRGEAADFNKQQPHRRMREKQAKERAAKRKALEERKLNKYLNSKKYTADLIRVVKFSMGQWE